MTGGESDKTDTKSEKKKDFFSKIGHEFHKLGDKLEKQILSAYEGDGPSKVQSSTKLVPSSSKSSTNQSTTNTNKGECNTTSAGNNTNTGKKASPSSSSAPKEKTDRKPGEPTSEEFEEEYFDLKSLVSTMTNPESAQAPKTATPSGENSPSAASAISVSTNAAGGGGQTVGGEKPKRKDQTSLNDLITRILQNVSKKCKNTRDECQRALDFLEKQAPGSNSVGLADQFYGIWKHGFVEAAAENHLRMLQTLLMGLQRCFENQYIRGDGVDYFSNVDKVKTEGASSPTASKADVSTPTPSSTAEDRVESTSTTIIAAAPSTPAITTSANKEERVLMDTIMESLCGEPTKISDETLLSQVSSTITAGILMDKSACHGASLMLGIRIMYASHRDVKSNEAMKSIQTSLLSCIRHLTLKMEQESQPTMERYLKSLQAKSLSTTGGNGGPGTSFASAGIGYQVSSSSSVSKRKFYPKKGPVVEGVDVNSKPEEVLDQFLTGYLQKWLNATITKEGGQSKDEEGGQKEDYVFVEEGGGEQAGKYGWCIVCGAPAPHFCKQTEDPVCSRECKMKNLDLLKNVDYHFPAPGASTDLDSTDHPNSTTDHPNSTTDPPTRGQAIIQSRSHHEEEEVNLTFELDKCIAHRDLLAVFGSLGKMAIRDAPVAQQDLRWVRGKRLALEMIQCVLQQAGVCFKASPKILQSIQQFVCLAVVKNVVSPTPRVFGLSLNIFLISVQLFREHLKSEIAVFIESVFLRILESGNSSYIHKQRLLCTFFKLLGDPKISIELFMNFDCDVGEKNLFERVIDCLGKIGQGRYTQSEHSYMVVGTQELELRILALESLVAMVSSLVNWADSRRDSLFNKLLPIGSDADNTTMKKISSELEISLTKILHTSSQGTSLRGTLSMIGIQNFAREGYETGSIKLQRQSSITGSTSSTAGIQQPGSESTIILYGDPPSNEPSSLEDSLLKQKERKKMMEEGISEFNQKPKKGMQIFFGNDFIREDDAQGVVDFFRNVPGLDKTKIGDYVGEPADFNREVMDSMLKSHSFKNLELDQALRIFLSDFRLPGEAQKIDRIVEKFAEKYVGDNPGDPDILDNADCAYVLAFSTIMLQTDLHNPNITKKMTVQDFIKNNRGINKGENMKDEYLSKLYHSILKFPITLTEDDDARTKLESQNAQSALAKMELFGKESSTIVIRSTKAMESIREKQKKSLEARNSIRMSFAGDDNVVVAGGTNPTTTPAGRPQQGELSWLPSSILYGEQSCTYVHADELESVVEVCRVLFAKVSWPLLATLSVLMETFSWTEPNENDLTEDGKVKVPTQNKIIELCCQGFLCCIKFSARLNLDTERDAFVSSLTKFTYLATIKEMRRKNIECIKVLLKVGLTEGNSLAGAWTHILHCISQLERLQLIREKPDSHYFEEEAGSNVERSPALSQQSTATGGAGSTAASAATTLANSLTGTPSMSASSSGQAGRKLKVGTGGMVGLVRMSEEDRYTEFNNSEAIISQINQPDIERIFSKSPELGDRAIVDFITALCIVSADELNLTSSEDMGEPRIFSLQKLVEVVDFNINASNIIRGEGVWREIMKVLNAHFSQVVTCRKSTISMFALDSLRQLVVKFLRNNKELCSYNLQSEFLKPMGLVLQTPHTSLEAKLFVISIIQTLIKGCPANLKSGWKTIFEILQNCTTVSKSFGISAGGQQGTQQGSQNQQISQQQKNLTVNSFAVLQSTIEQQPEYFRENFSEAMTTLVAFAQSPALSNNQALEALHLIFNSANVLSEKASAAVATEKAAAAEKEDNTENAKKNDDSNGDTSGTQKGDDMMYWLPMLRALSLLSGDPRREVRTRALNGLFDLLRKHGSTFNKDTWRMIFRGILFPLFDDIQLDNSSEHTKRQDTMCLSALSNCVALVDAHFSELEFLLGDVISVLVTTVTHSLESIARLGVEALKQLIEKSGDKFSTQNWDLIGQSLHQLFDATTPVAIQDDLYHVLMAKQKMSSGNNKAGAIMKPSGPGIGAKSNPAPPPISGEKPPENQRTSASSNPGTTITTAQGNTAQDTTPAVGGLKFNDMNPEEGGKDGFSSSSKKDTTATSSSTSSSTAPSATSSAVGSTTSSASTAASSRNSANKLPATRAEARAQANNLRQVQEKVDEVQKTVVTGCVVQLLLIDCVHSVFEKHASYIPRSVIVTILDALESSFTFAHDFNQRIQLRLELKRLGFMVSMRDLPGLLKQEREALTCYLGILFSLYNLNADNIALKQQHSEKGEGESTKDATEGVKEATTTAVTSRTCVFDQTLCDRLIVCCRSVILNYVKKDRQMQTMLRDPNVQIQSVEFEREITGLQPIITQVILQHLIQADEKNNETLPSSSSIESKANETSISGGAKTGKESDSNDPSRPITNLFKAVCPTLFPLLADLCLTNSNELRLAVREVLLIKVAPLLKL